MADESYLGHPQDVIDEVRGGTEAPEHEGETPLSALPADQARASQYLYRYRRLRDEHEQIAGLFEEEITALEARRDELLEPLAKSMTWLEEVLALWHQARLKEDPKAKTIKLPSGTLSSSDADDRWTYPNAEAFLKWAHDHAQGAVRPPKPGEETIDKKESRAALTEQITVKPDGTCIFKPTGELIPGLVVRPGGVFELGRFFKIDVGN